MLCTCHLLHAPRFSRTGQRAGHGCRSIPMQLKRGLQLKKHGNQLLEVLGGRAIHPINVAVGGFYRAPRKEDAAGADSRLRVGTGGSGGGHSLGGRLLVSGLRPGRTTWCRFAIQTSIR